MLTAAIEYSSRRGSSVKWNISGSSVDKDTFNPILKKEYRGFFAAGKQTSHKQVRGPAMGV